MTLEISNELGRMALAEKIVADIDAFCKENTMMAFVRTLARR